MSFTSTVKNEIINLEANELENVSELAAILNVLAIKEKNIKIVTENVSVAKRVFNLVKKLFKFSCLITVRKGYSFNKKYTYILETSDKINIEKGLGIDLQEKQLIPDNFVIEDEELKKAYLRGVFLACGSINDPKKSGYHLEFVFNNELYSIFIKDLLNHFSLKAKIIEREIKYMVYIKESEKISDFLKVIGAGGGLFYFEDIRIYRDHKNMTNRLNNCEQANVEKMMETASKQVKNIQLIIDEKLYEVLNDKLKVIVDYRLKYPEASLSELAEIISLETSENLTKSGVYHRMKKVENLTKKIVKN